MINSAKQKKFYNSFVRSWEITVENYYDRTGNLLGDGTDNGGTGSPDGKFDNVTGSTFSNSGGIDDILKRVGLTPPTTNTSQSGQYKFTGHYSGSQTITLYLDYKHSDKDDTYYNTLYFTAVPTDLAVALDKIIDGKTNANEGKFRRYPDNTTNPGYVGNWPSADPKQDFSEKTVNTMLIVDLP